MFRVLLRKSVRDLRGQMLGWGVGVGLLLTLLVVIFPISVELYKDMEIPPEMLAFFGPTASLDTIEGFLVLEFFSYGSVILAVFAIMAGTGALVSEEGDGTLDLLLAQPVARATLALAKAGGLALALAGTVLVAAAFTVVPLLISGTEAPMGRLANAFFLLWLFEVVVGLAAMALSLALPGRKAAGVLVAMVLVGSYILDSIANLIPDLEVLRPLLPTHYYQGEEALLLEVGWGATAALAALGVAALAAAVALFQRRDVGVGATWPGRWWRRKAQAVRG